MCDYSLERVNSRPAKVGDKLVVHDFDTGTFGFRSADDKAGSVRATAICLLPGTELVFSRPIQHVVGLLLSDGKVETSRHQSAVFRQVNKNVENRHHDVLELPDGKYLYLTNLVKGQEARVLQMPVQPISVGKQVEEHGIVEMRELEPV